MQDNKSRGNRTLFWMIVCIILFAVAGGLALAMRSLLGGINASDDATLGLDMMLLCVAFVACACVLSIAFCIEAVFWLLWMFRSVSNLRRLSKIGFGPWVAVILSCIPYVGGIIHYFVFKSIVFYTEKVLHKEDLEHASYVQPVQMKFVHAYMVAMLLGGVIGFLEGGTGMVTADVILGIVALSLYAKAFSQLIKEEQRLFSVYQEEQLRLQVSKVLRDREIEKAAAEVRRASYESEKPSESPAENQH